jgi:hypothetical protein
MLYTSKKCAMLRAAYLAMKAVNPEIRKEEDITLGMYL